MFLNGWGDGPFKNVFLEGNVVHRPAGSWTPSVHSLLNYLETIDFPASPRVVDSGFDDNGMETVTYIEGDFVQPGPWTLEGVNAVGQLIRDVHDATASYIPPSNATWRPFFGRNLGNRTPVIGHCDTGPWNIVARDGLPVALIDWDFSGPVDPMVDLAQTCWLNAKLHSDDVAEREGLPPLAERARHLRAVADGYGLTARERAELVPLMIEFAVHSAAAEADEFNIGPDTKSASGLWGIAWRSRAASWMIRNRLVLENALS